MTAPLPFDVSFVVPVEYDDSAMRLLEGLAAVLDDGGPANALMCECLACYAGETDPATHQPTAAELQTWLQIATMGARDRRLPVETRLSYERRARLIRDQIALTLRRETQTGFDRYVTQKYGRDAAGEVSR